MKQEIYQHTYPNGLHLLAERMDHVRSAAVNFLIPAGCIYEDPARLGVGAVLADMLTRGAGERSNREFTLALDNLGVDRSESVGSYHMRLWGATVASNLFPALDLYADMIRRPHLPAEDLEAVRSLAIQDIRGLEDEPASLVMTQLRKCHYPVPYSNDHRGTEATVNALTLDAVREHYAARFRPRGAIVSIAGNIEWEPLRQKVGELFGDWKGEASTDVTVGPEPEHRGHVTKDLEQTYITVAYPSVPFGHPLYYQAMGAVNVLSGNMSSRLFTEIREKHGLCYSVHASYSTLKDRGSIFCFAASLNHDAPKTLELLIHELKRLKDGIAQDEVDRVKAGLKSSQIMQQESTSARALALASDWFYLGRVRSFDEIRAGIQSLTPESIVDYVRQYPAENFTIVTLGPRPLQ